MKNKRWTFNGIRRYYPSLKFTDWLKMCVKGKHFRKLPHEVVSGVFEILLEGSE